jgi:phage baseplate assembly protein W
MEFILDTTLPAEVVIGATGVTEILQNVRTIVSTIKGSVPLDRDFGVSASFLDSPTPEAMAAFTGEAIDEIEKQEPRCSVVSVDFKPLAEAAMDGRLFPVIRIAIEGRYE